MHFLKRLRVLRVRLAQKRELLSGALFFVALTLIAVHGVESVEFKVDEITLGLLGFASIPLLARLLTSFKAGNVEVAFRDLSMHDQLFAFLDGIATKRQWTFFTPRAGEENMGPAFVVLTEQLLSHQRQRLVQQLRAWLASDDVNQRWFAAEIIGYHRITELRRAVGRAPETTDTNEDFEPWELNCLWAKSRFDETPYRTLKEFLAATKSRSNQAWVLRAFDRLVEANHDDIRLFEDSVSALGRRLAEECVSEVDLEKLAGGLRHFADTLVQVSSRGVVSRNPLPL
jgi:hypothetical protein